VERAATERRRIPCLDGLRALSIVLVLFSHARLTRGFPRATWIQSVQPFGLAGTGGVCLFFVISGYLITTLVLNERQLSGNVSLRNFYIRRSLRIFPVLYFYLLVALVLRKLGFETFTSLGWCASATFWQNFYGGHDYILGHTWSVSIEEQFYLLWPPIVSRLSERHSTRLALAAVIGWPLLRLLRHGFFFSSSGVLALNTAAHDTILYGCLLALLTRPEAGLGRTPHWVQSPLGLIIPALSLTSVYWTCNVWPGHLTFLLPLIRNVMLTWLLWWCVNNPRSLFGRILECKPIAFIGVISYSLYVWQQMFLFPSQTAWIYRYPFNLLAAFAAAILSFYLMERPLNALRRKFGSSGSNRMASQVGIKPEHSATHPVGVP
jgi:peptidoglycan/LPS O-acetylase OafA/YrhL